MTKKQQTQTTQTSIGEVFGITEADMLLVREEVDRLYKKHDTMTGLAHDLGLLAKTKQERVRLVKAYIYGRIVEDNERDIGGKDMKGAALITANILAQVSTRAMARGDTKTVQDIVEVLAEQNKQEKEE